MKAKEVNSGSGQTSLQGIIPRQPAWQKITLLIVLGYEAAGCLLGGAFLIAAPDGRLMDMPVEIMHGFFPDFLIPGIILLVMGILCTSAFISVMRISRSDWLMAGLALGGLLIWFTVEIIVLNELHWLHAMWGIPVLAGWVVLIPLIALRNDPVQMQKGLLACGVVSSLLYAVINVVVPLFYEGYSFASFTVSELSAIGAPTRILWVLLIILYPLLFSAFGWGVIDSGKGNRSLRTAGGLIILFCVFNFYWPPMHMREVIAAGGGTITDTLHIVWAATSLFLMLMIMGFGASATGKTFRYYTVATFIFFIVFGVLTGTESPGISNGTPTPYIGIWERLNIAAFMLWVVIFSVILLQRKEPQLQTQ